VGYPDDYQSHALLLLPWASHDRNEAKAKRGRGGGAGEEERRLRFVLSRVPLLFRVIITLVNATTFTSTTCH